MTITSMLLMFAAQSAFTVTNASDSGPVVRPANARLWELRVQRGSRHGSAL